MAIAIVDYCKGNLFSVLRWMQAAGYDAVVTDKPEAIEKADAIILPGVGAFRDASETMKASGQLEAIRRRVLHDGVAFLGICLGLQLLVAQGNEGSEEGSWAEGIGAIEGRCVRLDDTCPDGTRVKIPHVGWNSLEFEDASPSPLFDGVANGSYFYFTHSYCVDVEDPRFVTSYTTHATRFPSSLHQGNIFGTQFHPEKSSDVGLIVAHNFGKVVYGGV